MAQEISGKGGHQGADHRKLNIPTESPGVQSTLYELEKWTPWNLTLAKNVSPPFSFYVLSFPFVNQDQIQVLPHWPPLTISNPHSPAD